MAINVPEVFRTVLGLVAEDNPKFFKAPYLILAFNAATEHAFSELQSISEFQWLTKGTITIDSDDVTNKNRIYALPDRTIYVSNYTTDRYAFVADRDYRPKFGDCYLIDGRDYSINLPNFVLHQDPTETGTITFWYKATPARIQTENDSVTFFPDFFFNYYVAYIEWYCRRRDEDEVNRHYQRVVDELLRIRAVLNNAGGNDKQFRPNWDGVHDCDL